MQTSPQRPSPPHGRAAARRRTLACVAAGIAAGAALGTDADTARAAFPGENGPIVFSRDGDIVMVEPDGSNPRNVTQSGVSDRSPALSPDGSRLVFESYGLQGGDTDIFVANADGSEPSDITNNVLDDEQPTWSPDGSRIAFVGERAQTGGDIWVMNADGSGAKQITALSAFERFPAWSPDGRRIAFSYAAPRGGTEDVYVVDADGGSPPVNVTNDATGHERQPAWSPDGSSLAYTRVSSDDINGEVHVMRADGTEPRRLTFSIGVDGDPAFSPDGRKIAFRSTRAGSQDIFVMNADGSHPVNLTPTGASNESDPDWGPRVVAGDRTPPVLTLPTDITREATDPEGVPVSYTVTAADDVDLDPRVTCTPRSGSVFGLGTTTVRCTATDAAGNQASGAFDVVVRDTTAPALTASGSLERDATSPAGTAVPFGVTATDAIDPAPEVSCAPASGEVLPIGATVVRCTARDAAGNTGAVEFTVQVLGALEQIERLIGEIVDTANLPTAVADQLKAGLRNAARAVVAGNRAAACMGAHALERLIAAASGRTIPAAPATEWIADLRRIRAVLACGG